MAQNKVMVSRFGIFALLVAIIIFPVDPFADSTQAQINYQILFASDRDGNLEIYTMDPDGSNVQRLTNNLAQDIDPAWSPDRQQIAFVSNRDGNFGIYLMDANGRSLRRVTPDDGNYYAAPAWSPDGGFLALASDRAGNLDIYTLRTNGTDLRAVTTDPADDDEPYWSPDGSRIVFSSYRSGFSEIYTISINGGHPQQLTSGSGADNLAPVWSPDGQEIAFVASTGLYSEIYIMDATGANERVLITIDEYFIDSPTWSPDGQFIAYHVSNPGENATIRSIRADGQEAKQITTADYNCEWPAWYSATGGSVSLPSSSSLTIGSCPSAPALRLQIGQSGRVALGYTVNLRRSPSANASKITSVYQGSSFNVLDGPSCDEGYAWWKVNFQGNIGWLAEGTLAQYWLEPIQIVEGQGALCGNIHQRFNAGDTVVVSRTGEGLRILTRPYSTRENALSLAQPGDRLQIQDGPVCGLLPAYQEDTWYYYVYSATDNVSGWVADGPTYERWICPAANPRCDQ